MVNSSQPNPERYEERGRYTDGGASRAGFLDPKGRADHIVPRVYLRGFIHPERDQTNGPLEVFELASNAWGRPRSPDELCTEVGFYDYSIERAEVTADYAFRELEDGFYEVRNRLRRNHFADWRRDLDFLLRFGKMLAVRSRMFREGLTAAVLRETISRVVETDGTNVRLEPFDIGREPDRENLLKNRSITDMRVAIAEGPAEWINWDWGLRLAPGPACPFITSDHPPVITGADPDAWRAYRRGQFSLVIPFGWDFALIGGPRFDERSGPVFLPPDEMDEYRIVSTSGAQDFLISPLKLLDMKWFGRVKPAVPMTPR